MDRYRRRVRSFFASLMCASFLSLGGLMIYDLNNNPSIPPEPTPPTMPSPLPQDYEKARELLKKHPSLLGGDRRLEAIVKEGDKVLDAYHRSPAYKTYKLADYEWWRQRSNVWEKQEKISRYSILLTASLAVWMMGFVINEAVQDRRNETVSHDPGEDI